MRVVARALLRGSTIPTRASRDASARVALGRRRRRRLEFETTGGRRRASAGAAHGGPSAHRRDRLRGSVREGRGRELGGDARGQRAAGVEVQAAAGHQRCAKISLVVVAERLSFFIRSLPRAKRRIARPFADLTRSSSARRHAAANEACKGGATVECSIAWEEVDGLEDAAMRAGMTQNAPESSPLYKAPPPPEKAGKADAKSKDKEKPKPK